MAAISSSLKPLSLSLLLLSYSSLLLTHPPPTKSPNPRRRLLDAPPTTTNCSLILTIPSEHRCSLALTSCELDSSSHLNYISIPFCIFPSYPPSASLLPLSLLLLLHFHLLVTSASLHFSPVVSSLSRRLRLSPSMAAVTLLSLGNGAPDLFSSLAALRSHHPRTGLSAILSAGAFVSAFVVGNVAIQAAPFTVQPGPFVRDVFFYIVAASGLFYVYLSAEIYLWQAVGFVVFYLFFVGIVVWMDFFGGERGGGREVEMEVFVEDCEAGVVGKGEGNLTSRGGVLFNKVAQIWEVPISVILKLTIPSPSKRSRFYDSANIALCPLILLYSLSSFIPLDRKIVFLIPQYQFPLWSVVLVASSFIAVIHYAFEKEPAETERDAAAVVAFMMSVFWISTVAGELLNCLAAIATILDLPPGILGLTVLAWGNSVGDLVADVALAKAGKPATAMAGCFAGPMFNMLVGLGIAMVIETARVYPEAYELRFHVGVVVAFVFLLLSLMGSLLVITWCNFRVHKFWGFCLVGLYLLFTAVSLVIARFSG